MGLNPFKKKPSQIDPEAAAKAAHGLGMAHVPPVPAPIAHQSHVDPEAAAKAAHGIGLAHASSAPTLPHVDPEAAAKAAHGVGLAHQSNPAAVAHNHNEPVSHVNPEAAAKAAHGIGLAHASSAPTLPHVDPEAAAKAAHGKGLAAASGPVIHDVTAGNSSAHTGAGGLHEPAPKPIGPINHSAGFGGGSTSTPVSTAPVTTYIPKPAEQTTSHGLTGGTSYGSGHDMPLGNHPLQTTEPASKPAGSINRSAGFSGNGLDTMPTPDWTAPNIGTAPSEINAHGDELAMRDSKDGNKVILQMSDGTYQTVDKTTGAYSGSAGTWGDGHGGGHAINGVGNPAPSAVPTPTGGSATTGSGGTAPQVVPQEVQHRFDTAKAKADDLLATAPATPPTPTPSLFNPPSTATATAKSEDMFAPAPPVTHSAPAASTSGPYAGTMPSSTPSTPPASSVMHPPSFATANAKSQDMMAPAPLAAPTPAAPQADDVVGRFVGSRVTLPPTTANDTPPTGLAGFTPSSTAPSNAHIPRHFADF